MPRLFGTETISHEDLARDIAAGRTVWLIFRRPEYAWAQHEMAGLPAPKRVVQSEAGRNPAVWAVQW